MSSTLPPYLSNPSCISKERSLTKATRLINRIKRSDPPEAAEAASLDLSFHMDELEVAVMSADVKAKDAKAWAELVWILGLNTKFISKWLALLDSLDWSKTRIAVRVVSELLIIEEGLKAVSPSGSSSLHAFLCSCLSKPSFNSISVVAGWIQKYQSLFDIKEKCRAAKLTACELAASNEVAKIKMAAQAERVKQGKETEETAAKVRECEDRVDKLKGWLGVIREYSGQGLGVSSESPKDTFLSPETMETVSQFDEMNRKLFDLMCSVTNSTGETIQSPSSTPLGSLFKSRCISIESADTLAESVSSHSLTAKNLVRALEEALCLVDQGVKKSGRGLKRDERPAHSVFILRSFARIMLLLDSPLILSQVLPLLRESPVSREYLVELTLFRILPPGDALEFLAKLMHVGNYERVVEIWFGHGLMVEGQHRHDRKRVENEINLARFLLLHPDAGELAKGSLLSFYKLCPYWGEMVEEAMSKGVDGLQRELPLSSGIARFLSSLSSDRPSTRLQTTPTLPGFLAFLLNKVHTGRLDAKSAALVILSALNNSVPLDTLYHPILTLGIPSTVANVLSYLPNAPSSAFLNGLIDCGIELLQAGVEGRRSSQETLAVAALLGELTVLKLMSVSVTMDLLFGLLGFSAGSFFNASGALVGSIHSPGWFDLASQQPLLLTTSSIPEGEEDCKPQILVPLCHPMAALPSSPLRAAAALAIASRCCLLLAAVRRGPLGAWGVLMDRFLAGTGPLSPSSPWLRVRGDWVVLRERLRGERVPHLHGKAAPSDSQVADKAVKRLLKSEEAWKRRNKVGKKERAVKGTLLTDLVVEEYDDEEHMSASSSDSETEVKPTAPKVAPPSAASLFDKEMLDLIKDSLSAGMALRGTVKAVGVIRPRSGGSVPESGFQFVPRGRGSSKTLNIPEDNKLWLSVESHAQVHAKAAEERQELKQKILSIADSDAKRDEKDGMKGGRISMSLNHALDTLKFKDLY